MGENRISSGFFVKFPLGRTSRILTIGYKSGFISSGSSDWLIINALE